MEISSIKSDIVHKIIHIVSKADKQKSFGPNRDVILFITGLDTVCSEVNLSPLCNSFLERIEQINGDDNAVV